MSEPLQLATFEVHLVAADKVTRRRWNGGAFASAEASAALTVAVDAFQAAIRGAGFAIVNTGYGVFARDLSEAAQEELAAALNTDKGQS